MDDEMDSCEAYWNHELAIRRLLAWMRQGQAYCTDTECFDVPTPSNSNAFGADNNFFMMTTVLIMAVLLFVLRPSSIRQPAVEDANEKHAPAHNHHQRRDGGHDDGPSPAVD